MRQADYDIMLRDRVRKDIAWWREVFLLACGTQKSTPRSIADIVDKLIPQASAGLAAHKAEQVQLAAQALVETEFSKAAGAEGDEPGRYTLTYDRIRDLNLRILTAEKIPAKSRARSGAWLGQLGDPRTEITTVENMPFCLVPAGDL